METTVCTTEEIRPDIAYQKSDCLQRLILKAAKTGNVKLLTYCDADVGAQINSTYTDGETLAHVGARNGHVNVVEWSLKRDRHFFINAVDEFNNTLLHAAAIGGHAGVVDYVAYADSALLHVTNKAGFTALHEAAARGHKRVVLFLVQRWKVPPSQTSTCENYTPALLAAEHGHVPVLTWLLEWDSNLAHVSGKCDYNLLHWTTYNRLRNETALLCEKYDVQYRDNCDGETPMHMAYRMGSFRTADVLADVCQGSELETKKLAPCNTVAHEAAKNGNLEALEHLDLRNKTYSNLVNDFGQTPTMLAAKSFHFSLVRYLISKNADIHVKDKEGDTILHYTACNPHLSIVKHLWKRRKDIARLLNATNEVGESSIYTAASCYNLNFIKYVVGKGADLNIPTVENKTALTVAVVRDDLRTVEYLIQNVADTKRTDKNGLTPLHYAESKQMKELIRQYFPDFSANGTLKSSDGPCKPIGSCSVQEAPAEDDLDYITSCYFNKIRGFIDVPHNWTEVMAHQSAASGHFRVVQWLLENEKDLIERRDDKNNTILHSAAKGGSVELVDLVASTKMSLLPEKNAAGFTALHVAVASGHKPVVVHLVERWKMWPEETTAFTNDTAPILAAKHSRNQILEWFLERDPTLARTVGECNNNLLHWTSAWGNTPMVELLCRKYEVKSLSNCNGDFPIHLALRNSHYDLADVLNKMCRANLLQPKGKFPYNTAAHEAARTGDLDTLEYLDSKNMTRDYVDLRNDLWQPPVFLALEANQYEVVNFLVDVHNIDLKWFDKNGDSILHMLARNQDLKILQYLEKVRYDEVRSFLNLGNRAGETPVYKATWYGNVPLVRYLVSFLGAYTRIPANDRTAPLLVAIQKESYEMVELLSRKGYIKRLVSGSELEAWDYAYSEKMREFVKKILLCPARDEPTRPLMVDGFVTLERERRMVEQSDYPVIGTSTEPTAVSLGDTGFLGNTLLLMGTLTRKFLGWKSEFGSRTRHPFLSPQDVLRDRVDPVAIEAVYDGHYFDGQDEVDEDNDE